MKKKEVMDSVLENTPAEGGVHIQSVGIEENLVPVVPNQPQPVQASVETPAPAGEKKLINCLRNERIAVKFIPSPNAMVQAKGHVLSGGMSEKATVSFVVPKLSTGIYKNVLTDSEKDYLEYVMGLEKNALSVYRKNDNFWDDSNPNGIGRVVLHKQTNYFDLSIPSDYIKYKILLANNNLICPSLQQLEEAPKATYRFVVVSETAETQLNLSKMDATKRCYMEYGKIENDRDTLRVIIEIVEGRPTTAAIRLDFLQAKINDYIQKSPRKFLSIIQDQYLPAKVLIKKAVEAGIVGMKNDMYYLRDGNLPLCELGQESTLDNAASYISSPRRQELKFSLEAKVKQ